LGNQRLISAYISFGRCHIIKYQCILIFANSKFKN